MVLLLSLFACADPDPVETSFAGPGYDADDGLLVEQDTFLLAVTELHVINAPEPGKVFGDHAQAVGNALFDPDADVPGFVGGSFRNIGQLQWWTMTVWTDETSMMQFVLSEPHESAMGDLSACASSARTVHVEIPAEDVPTSWDLALDTIADVPWVIGDGS